MKTEKEKGRHEAEACNMAMCTSFGTSAVDGVDYEDKKREHPSPWTLRTFSKEAKRKSRSVSLAPFYPSILSRNNPSHHIPAHFLLTKIRPATFDVCFLESIPNRHTLSRNHDYEISLTKPRGCTIATERSRI